jgi:hypothetical protein
MTGTAEYMSMSTHRHLTGETDESALSAALPNGLDSIFHESWTCGNCGREFSDCTSCVAHEEQCGGLSRW